MTVPRIDDHHKKEGKFRISLDSQTTGSKMYKTPKMTINGVSTTLKLRDIVGFGAMYVSSYYSDMINGEQVEVMGLHFASLWRMCAYLRTHVLICPTHVLICP
jgi:outer membrane receptor for monomeric catechols